MLATRFKARFRFRRISTFNYTIIYVLITRFSFPSDITLAWKIIDAINAFPMLTWFSCTFIYIVFTNCSIVTRITCALIGIDSILAGAIMANVILEKAFINVNFTVCSVKPCWTSTLQERKEEMKSFYDEFALFATEKFVKLLIWQKTSRKNILQNVKKNHAY